MFTATIHVNLDNDYALSDLKVVKDGPFNTYQYEIIDEKTLKFVIDTGKYRDEVIEILHEKDAIQSLKCISDSQLLITKQSSGILPIIRKNHGILQKMSQFDGTRRTFDIVVFDREDLKAIVEDVRNLGTVRLERLRPFAGPSSLLSSRQYEVLEFAHEAGYFDWPRRTDAETLADQLDISHATFLEHLRKAEKKIVNEALSGAASRPEIISYQSQ